MIKRYLLIGIISVSVIFLAVAIITAKPGLRSRQNTPVIAELTAKAPSPATRQSTGEIKVSDANSTKAVLDVQGMSCSGCVNEIKSSLAGVEGIAEVLVDINGGRVEVYYDAKKLKNVGKIASAITGVGYPAALKRTLTRDEIEKQNGFFASRSKLYIAAVGDWEISRNDYDTELAHARNRYEKIYGKDVLTGDQGNALIQRLKSQVVSSLINEGIQMQEIRKSGFKLSPKTVEFEFNVFLSQKGIASQNFRVMVEDTGYDYNYFLKKFENRLTINRYVEENVLSAVSNDLEKQQQYSDWYNNARLLAKVVYYDRQLETIVKNSSNTSGCGSTCTRK
jgi:copper chaperone